MFKHNIGGIKVGYLVLVAILTITSSTYYASLDNYSYSLTAYNDQGAYQRIGVNLCENGRFSSALGPDYPFNPVRPPLYPLIISAVSCMSHDNIVIIMQIIQHLLNVITAILIGYTAFLMTDRKKLAFLITSILYALCPLTSAMANVILAETTANFLLVLSVYLFIRYLYRYSINLFILFNLALGFLILTRPTFFFFPIIFYLYLLVFRGWKIALKSIAISLPIIVFLLLPWTIANYKAGGRYTPLRLSGPGALLFVGVYEEYPDMLKPWLNKNTGLPHDKTKDILEEIKRYEGKKIEFSEETIPLIIEGYTTYLKAYTISPPDTKTIIAVDDFMKEAIINWIGSNKKRYGQIVGGHIKNLLFDEYNPLIYSKVSEGIMGLSLWYRYILFPLSLLGLLIGIFRFREAAFLFGGIFIYLVTVHSSMHVEPRYILGAYPFLMVLVSLIPEARGKKQEVKQGR